jgi:Uma2 family endonuclease
MVYLLPKSLSFDDFFQQYGDDPRYELIDGELREMEPTGLHESVAGKLAGRLFMEIFPARISLQAARLIFQERSIG